MSSYEQETLRLISAMPDEHDACFGCHVPNLRRANNDEVAGLLEEIVLWPITAEALQAGRTRLNYLGEEYIPLRAQMVAECLLKRASGLCPVYAAEEYHA